MASDPNWRIRKMFFIFIQTFLKPTRDEIRDDQKQERHKFFSLGKETKKIFKELIEPILLKAFDEANMQVAFEGILLIQQYEYLFNQNQLISLYKPLVE